ncbi:hypothetical protein ACLOJK_028305 [Asimina triloba]
MFSAQLVANGFARWRMGHPSGHLSHPSSWKERDEHGADVGICHGRIWGKTTLHGEEEQLCRSIAHCRRTKVNVAGVTIGDRTMLLTDLQDGEWATHLVVCHIRHHGKRGMNMVLMLGSVMAGFGERRRSPLVSHGEEEQLCRSIAHCRRTKVNVAGVTIGDRTEAAMVRFRSRLGLPI